MEDRRRARRDALTQAALPPSPDRDGIARLEAPLGKVGVVMGEAIEEVWIVVEEENWVEMEC
jgi:hypothetical protein